MSKHRFPYKWKLADGYPAKGIDYHGCKVFGTFICGGGSSMGYKLAGYDHLGGVEIDPQVADIYKTNHDPKYLFVEDIREFNKRSDLPAELYDLDLLDGSPPCSSFSTAGNREKDWGKSKKFREGQEDQRLDDLVFQYVATLENVTGLIKGNAKAYAKQIHKEFTEAGYRVQLFVLNAASMGVPQKRERVFFIGLRVDLKLPKLGLEFDEPVIPYGVIRIEGDKDPVFTDQDKSIWDARRDGDKDFGDVNLRIKGTPSCFNAKFIYDEAVCFTITSSSGSKLVSVSEPKRLSAQELSMCGSYPMDYDFKDLAPKYLIGMSVPPVMTAQIAHQIYDQWLSKLP